MDVVNGLARQRGECRADRSIAAPLISGDIDAHLGTAAHATVVAVQVSAARCRCRRCGLA